MFGVAMKTYIRDVDTKKKSERRLTDRVHANMSQWEGVQQKKKLSEPWCECNINEENLWGLTQLKLCQKWYSLQVLGCEEKFSRQHELVNSEQHLSDKTEPMVCDPGGEWRGSWLSEEYRRSFAEVLHISSWVFGKSAGAKGTFWEMNKERIYLDEQRIRGVEPISKRVWSVFIQNSCTLSRDDESNCYTRGNVTSCLCFDYCTRWAAQWVFIQSLGLVSAHVEEFAVMLFRRREES